MVLTLQRALGTERAAPILRDMERVALQDTDPALPSRAKKKRVEGGREGYGYDPTLGAFRTFDDLSWSEIEDMLLCGPIIETLQTKKAGLHRAWRNSREWQVYHPDEKFAALVKANMERVLPSFLTELLTNLEYGTYFGNPVWGYTTPEQLGVNYEALGIPAQKRFAGLTEVRSAAPETIKRILYTKGGRYSGYEQYTKKMGSTPMGPVRTIERYQSLISPYNGLFRNLWGRSWLEPMWPLMYWYDVLVRSFMRFLERLGEPKVKARAPMYEKIENSDGEMVKAIDAMLEIGSDLPNTTALSIPSDRDETGNPKYDVEYMEAESRVADYIAGIQSIRSLIKGAGMTGEAGYVEGKRQSESYAAAEVHSQAADEDNERILAEEMKWMNLYLLPKFSLWNLGGLAPAPTLTVAGLDRRTQERLSKFLSSALTTSYGEELMMMINWREAMHGVAIPVISEKELEALQKKREDDALRKQERFAEAQAKYQPEPRATGGSGGAPKAGEDRPKRGASRAGAK